MYTNPEILKQTKHR